MKILPLVYPTIDSLPQHSYIMSILEVNHSIDQLIFDKYIQLKIDEYRNEVVVLDYCEDDFLSFLQFKDNSYLLERREICGNIVEFIIEHIENNYYVFLHVDEFFLPFSRAYKKHSFGHGVMIYGYSEKEKVLNVVGYDISNKISFNIVSYSELCESYEKLTDYYKLNTDEYLKKIFLLKPRYVGNNVNGNLIVGLINEYKNSTNTLKSYVKDYCMDCNTFFGLSTYKVLIRYYKLALQDTNIRLLTKNLYILLEHKKIMKFRTEFFLKSIGRENTELSKSIDIICKNIRIAVGLNIKFDFTKDKGNIEKIINILERVYSMELDYIDNFLILIN